MRSPRQLHVAVMAWLALAVVVASATSCATESLDLTGKACPCAPGWTCDVATSRCTQGPQADVPDTGSDVPDVAIDVTPPPLDASAQDAYPPPPSDASRDSSADAGSCGVRPDGKLYCTNRPSDMYKGPHFATPIVDALMTTYSYFECWALGDLHAGQNTTWYRTQGDRYQATGYVPAVILDTQGDFDANPTAHGLAQCASP